MALLKCPRCGYIWDYTGQRTKANCPVCHLTLYHLSQCAATAEEYQKQIREECRQRCDLVK